MNRTKLQRAIDHLDFLCAIRKEQDEEDALALLLLALLATLYEDGDYATFRLAFLNELKLSFESLDPDGIYGDLIDQELAVQSGYLTNFIRDLRNGSLSEAQAKNRARMYSSSLGKLRELFKLKDYDEDQMLKWVLGEAEHCDDCVSLDGTVRSAKTWAMTIYPRSGGTQCISNCKCDLVPV